MKFKSAFTLAEIMIFMIVVATLISILFITSKPLKMLKDKNVKYRYAAAYDALNLASYDLTVKEDTDPFNVTGENSDVEAFKRLCNGLAEYINTESTDCSAPISDSTAFMTDERFDFRTLTPNLTAQNGITFYISKLISDDVEPKTSRSYYNVEDPDFTLKFFMVYVDLNGKDTAPRPHSIISHNIRQQPHPDVFAFAVIPTGDAIPMGIAEYDVKYLSTRVAYTENSSTYYSAYYPLRKAKHLAWNLYSTSGTNTTFRQTVSFTYNDYVKEILRRHSTQLYHFNAGNIYPESYDAGISSKCRPPAGTALTVYDMCRINVDTPNFGATH